LPTSIAKAIMAASAGIFRSGGRPMSPAAAVGSEQNARIR
jgi:hypothetical protein